jgi:hypothetical protein
VGLSEKLLVGFLSLLLGCAAVFSIYFGLQSSREYGHALDREQAASQRLDTLHGQITSQNAYLTALQTDTDFQKRVIREKIGYAYPNERILHFARPQ